MSQEPEKRSPLATILDQSETVVYYGAVLALLVTIGVLFVSAGASLLAVFEKGPLETALTVLDRLLLIFIFVELLNTIGIVVQEREIVAEPFLLIGLIAVVRRILLVTAEAGQAVDPERFLNLVIELGVLTALVISLAAALYFTRRAGRRQEAER
ncbi:MAG TPA: phosphate-starvation-inducible PsiE family protein [Rubrobacteraceae bacterium]|nr:phosphate-starvation-inducible PsiE family protein [Rubrobacteraceae bacterium]